MTASPSFDATLLPPADQSVRCAAHAESIGLDPGGTALRVDELIVVDVALPWPKPVWAADGFTAVPELVLAAEESGRQVRVLAAVPLDDGVGRVVTHVRERGATMTRTEHRVEPANVVDVLSLLLIEGPAASPATVATVEAPRRELLLCTQGSHDVCCGSHGAALAVEIEASHPEVGVRRVSHTGGHRMAPTGVTLPDGRMWGMLDHAEITAILDRTRPPSALAARCRGWTGAAEGPGQVAERAVFAEVDDWLLDDEPRTVTITPGPGSDVEVLVATSAHRWTVRVEMGRAVPTIACGEPGGLPAKPGTEWIVRAIAAI